MKQIAGNNLSILYNIIKTEYPSLSHPLISNQYVFAENKLNILRNEAKSLSAGYKHIRELGIKLGFITPTDPNEKNQINS